MSFSFRQTYEKGLENLLLSLKTAPHNPVHKLDLYEWANMRRRSSPCWYCHSKFSPRSSIRPLLKTVMLTEEATVTEMFTNLHHVSFSWDNVLGQRLLIYMHICLFFIPILFKRLYSFHDSLNSTCKFLWQRSQCTWRKIPSSIGCQFHHMKWLFRGGYRGGG